MDLTSIRPFERNIAAQMRLWLLAICALSASQMFGEGDDKRIPSLYFITDVSLFVAKSDAIGGTDFGTAYLGEAGVWTGKGKNISFAVRQDAHVVDFTQINGKLTTTWRDFMIGYRYSWFNPALLVGSCQMRFESAEVTLVDSLCTTIGGAMRFRVPMGPSVTGVMQFDLVTVDALRDVAGADNDLTTRLTWETGIQFNPNLTWLNLGAGYRYRSFALDSAGQSASEMQTGPFINFQLGLDL